jgi:hypothetical protein
MLVEWQLWMHPYPSMIKANGKRINPRHIRYRPTIAGKDTDAGYVRVKDLFEGRRPTSPQLKRCVRAVALKNDGDVSKAFAICTKQLQKTGYIKVGTQVPTKAGETAGRSKAADKGHAEKVLDYEALLKLARGKRAAE